MSYQEKPVTIVARIIIGAVLILAILILILLLWAAINDEKVKTTTTTITVTHNKEDVWKIYDHQDEYICSKTN